MAKRSAKSDLPAVVDDATLDEIEAAWPKTKELAFAIDDPLEKLLEKAHNIFAGKYWENLDALALRIADVCPQGVTEENFLAAQPVAKACRSYFANVEKLRTGLNRPFLDAKKAVDEAAKATVTRAEGTLLPIITAVKKIEDRKKEEAAEAERLRLKKIEDDRLAAEKAHRDMIEAEHAAEKKRLADKNAELERQAAQARADTERLERERKEAEARNKATNDELAQLRKQIEEMGKPKTPEKTEEFIDGLGTVVVADLPAPEVKVGKQPEWHPDPMPPLFTDVPAQEDWEKARDDEHRDQAGELPSRDPVLDADQQKVREIGTAIIAFQQTLRPNIANPDAKTAVSLALFDICEIGNRLLEWTP